MATSGGPIGPRYPAFLDPGNEFGKLIILEMRAKENRPLPNPFIIGESVEAVIGGSVESARSDVQRTQCTIEVRNPVHAEKLIGLTELSDGTPVCITLHPKLNLSKCILSTTELLHMTEQDIQDALTPQGVIGVKRITRIVDRKKENTPALILSFNSTTYPEHVKVGLTRVATKPFYPNPLQCYGCYRFGHLSVRCPGPKRCYNCSGEHVVEKCDEPAQCVNCEADHRSTFRRCPAYQHEMKVVKVKVDYQLSYPEARRRLQNGNSYAEAAAQPSMSASRYNALMESIEKKNRQIEELIASVNEKSQEIQNMSKKMDSMKTYIAMLAEKVRNQPESLQKTKQPKQTDPIEMDQTTETGKHSGYPKRRNHGNNSKQTAPEIQRMCPADLEDKSPPPKRLTLSIAEQNDPTDFPITPMYVSDTEGPVMSSSSTKPHRHGK